MAEKLIAGGKHGGGTNTPTLYTDAADFASEAALDAALKAVSASTYTNAYLAVLTPNDKAFALRLARNDIK